MMNEQNAQAIASAALRGDWASVSNMLRDVLPAASVWQLKETYEQLANACENEYYGRDT